MGYYTSQGMKRTIRKNLWTNENATTDSVKTSTEDKDRKDNRTDVANA